MPKHDGVQFLFGLGLFRMKTCVQEKAKQILKSSPFDWKCVLGRKVIKIKVSTIVAFLQFQRKREIENRTHKMCRYDYLDKTSNGRHTSVSIAFNPPREEPLDLFSKTLLLLLLFFIHPGQTQHSL